MWLSSPGEVIGYRRADLDAVADGKAERAEPVFLVGANETGSAVLAKGTQPLGFLAPDGSGWFATNRGPIQIAASMMIRRSLGPVLINKVLVSGNEVPLSARITLPPNESRLEINYSLLQLRSQRDVRFEYFLDGFDNGWVDAGSRRVAYYTNLRAGTYRFRVRATEIGNPGVFSEAALVVEQKPHVYQTWWFVCLSVLVAGAVILGAIRFRLHQVKLRFAAVYKERQRLATEMHDTIIQGCTGISALLEAFSRIYSTESQMRLDLIEHARNQARTTIQEARAAIFNLRVESGEVRDLRPHLQSIAEQLAGESKAEVRFQSTGEPFPVSHAAMHEIVMVVREAVWNALKHAQALMISLRASFDSDSMELQVEDDGIGFDKLPPDEKPGQHGLTGMRQRAQRLGGQLEFSSMPGGGAKVCLKLQRRSIAAGRRGGLQWE
jgi:signal transduction histidine kinase